MKILIIMLVNLFWVFTTVSSCSSVSAQTTNYKPIRQKNQIEYLPGVRLEKIEVYGNTVFDQKELENLVAPYLGKNLSFEQLRQITIKITDLYTSKGYFSSGAFFPEQEITDGTAIVRVVEGKLERVETTGLEKLKENYLRSRLQWNTEAPVNIKRLEEDIQLLQQDPLIEKIDAKLVEGSSMGQSVLLLDMLN